MANGDISVFDLDAYALRLFAHDERSRSWYGAGIEVRTKYRQRVLELISEFSLTAKQLGGDEPIPPVANSNEPVASAPKIDVERSSNAPEVPTDEPVAPSPKIDEAPPAKPKDTPVASSNRGRPKKTV